MTRDIFIHSPAMDEKQEYVVKATSAEIERDLVQRKGSVIGEAAVLYGDVETAEHYGYVERGYVLMHCSGCFLLP